MIQCRIPRNHSPIVHYWWPLTCITGSLWSGELLTSPGVVDCTVTTSHWFPPSRPLLSWTQSHINILHTPELWLVISGSLCPVWSDRQIIVILYWRDSAFELTDIPSSQVPLWIYSSPVCKVMHIFVLGVHLLHSYTLTKLSVILIEIRGENIRLISLVHWTESNSRVSAFL